MTHFCSKDYREPENTVELKLSEKYPTRYQKTDSGIWQCPPGSAYAQQFGLKYYVRSDAQLEPIKIQNLMFLEDYVKFTANVSPQIQTLALERVQQKQGITLAELLASLDGVRANDLYGMIASEQLYVDLGASPLVDHSQVRLYSDQSSYDAYALIEQHQLFSNQLSFTDKEVQALMSAASPQDLEQANYRFTLVQAYQEGQLKNPQNISLRTRRALGETV